MAAAAIRRRRSDDVPHPPLTAFRPIVRNRFPSVDDDGAFSVRIGRGIGAPLASAQNELYSL